MQKSASKGVAYAMLTGSVVVWAGSTVAGKLAVTGFPPYSVGVIRFGLSSVVLACILLWKDKRISIPPRGDWPIMFFLGIIGIFGANSFFLIGLQYSTAINSSLIIAGSPIVISIFSAIILRERIHPNQVLGIILSFLGVVIVIIKGSWIVLTSLSFNIGDLLLLFNPICWGLYTVLCKKVTNRYSSLHLTVFPTWIAIVFFVPGMFFEAPWANPAAHLSFTGVIAIFYLAIASTLGVFWWNKGIASVGASKSGIFMNGVPIVTIFLSALFLGEKTIPAQIVGAVMVISGVYLNSLTNQTFNLSKIFKRS